MGWKLMEKSSINFPWIDKTYNLLLNHFMPIYIHIYKPTSFHTCKIRQCQLQRIVDNFLSYHRFASSVYEKSRDYLFPLDHWSVFAFVISETVIKIHTNWRPCSSKHDTDLLFRPTLSLPITDLLLPWALYCCLPVLYFLKIWHRNLWHKLSARCRKKRSQVLSLILNFWGKMCCWNNHFFLGMKDSIYYYWHANWNHIQKNGWWNYTHAF